MRNAHDPSTSVHRTALGRLLPLSLIVAVVLLMVPGGFALPLAPHGTPIANPVGGHVLSATAGRPASPGAHTDLGRPSASLNVTPQFFNNFWSAGNVSGANTSCNSPIGWCYTMSQNPSLVSLANGNLGLGFSALTNFTSAPACSTGNVTSRIGWTSSSDEGGSFAPLRYIGNNGSAGCPYFDGIEPSFAVGGSGTVFGAFVATNATPAQMYTTTAVGVYGSGRPVLDYLYRPFDALAIVNSTDNGSTWSAMRLLVGGGNISAPQVATFGRSVYIVFTNISNSSSPIPGSAVDSSRLEVIHSTNGGATWSSPVSLPGYLAGATSGQNYNTMDPSISVSPSGKIAIAYAADRSCWAQCTSYNTVYADDIVVSTSSSNGSTWSAPAVAARGVTEFGYGSSNAGGPAIWEGAITTTVQWGSATNLYVAWSQTEDLNLTDQYATQLDYWATGIDSAASTNGGTSWSRGTVTNPLPGLDYNQEVFGFGYFNPALAVHNGTVYLAYSFYNWTNGGTGRNSYLQNAYGDGNGEWIATSSDGVAWNSPTLIIMDPQGSGITDFDYWGYLGSIAFDSQGLPVVAYALQTAFLTFSTNIDLPVAIMVASPYEGPTTTVTIRETGLASGTLWQAQISGMTVSTTASEFNVTDVPVGHSFYVIWPGAGIPMGYRAELMPQITYGPLFWAYTPSVDTFNFTTFYGIQFSVNPGNAPGLTIESANFNGNDNYQFYYYWAEQLYSFGSYYYSYGANFPWYFPAGTWLNYSSGYFGQNYYYGSTAVGYWSGTGAGAYTGSSSTPTLQVLGAINETAWMAASGNYDETIGAPTLPSTSTYSFSINGGSYSGAGGSNVVVPKVPTGAYDLTNISATSTQPNSAYFGYPDSANPVVVPNQPTVNLSFALVNISSSLGTVSFHAVGLPTGADWQLSFNGTKFSASSPWINVTTRSGQFQVQGFPTVGPTGNQSYVPSSIGSGGTVTVGQTYDVNFTSTYRVHLEASAGGTLSKPVGDYFLGPGAPLQVTATPSVGFRFAGWVGSGSGAYNGANLTANLTVNSPVIESGTFVPLAANRFNVTINETGIPNGTEWGAVVGGIGYSSTTPHLVIANELSCVFSGSQGRYSLAVPFAHANGSGVRYVPTSSPQTVCGGGAAATVQFKAEYSVAVTAAVGGTVSAIPSAGGSIDSPYWIPSGGSVTLSATPLSGYAFVSWTGTGPNSYSGTAPDPVPLTVVAPINEIATFSAVVPPAPMVYTATFVESPTFVPGTVWTISNSTTSVSSATPDIVISGLSAGTYTFNLGTVIVADGHTRYQPTSSTATANVLTGNASVPVAFTPQYWASVTAVGPGVAGPASQWVAAAGPIYLTATPTGTATFVGWAGTGAGSYTGTSPNGTVHVQGPITEVASFQVTPPAVTPTQSSSGTGTWGNPIVWAALGLAGLAVGAIAGVLVARGRRPPPEMEPLAEPPTDDVGPEGMADEPGPALEEAGQ